MKRVLLIILLHLSLFFIVFAYHAQAEEDEIWTIDKYESLTFARVYGEVIHGDSLNFFIQSKDNCEKVWHNFTFYTYEQPGDINQLLKDSEDSFHNINFRKTNTSKNLSVEDELYDEFNYLLDD